MSACENVLRLYSDEYQELTLFCRGLSAPFTEHDVRAFNALYRCVYRRLSREERRRAERLVDDLIEGLERPELASLIFGVV